MIHKGDRTMRIDITDRKSVMVELSKDDLSKSEITYEQLDYSNAKTQQLVRSILEKIRSETGFFFGEYSSLEVEVMPDSFGGCLMIFKEGDCSGKQESRTALFWGENISSFIDGSRVVYKSFGCLPPSKLYQRGEEYFLLVRDCPQEISALLCEYLSGTEASGTEREILLEHSTCLIDENALVVLCGKCL